MKEHKCWKPDWKNPFQLKFFVFFDHEDGCFKRMAHTTTEVSGIQYMDEQSAETIVQMCNSNIQSKL